MGGVGVVHAGRVANACRCWPVVRHRYQAKNTFVLYDALGTFCDCMGPEVLNLPAYTAKLLSPLHKRWNALMDDDRQLLPLLECMTSVARALGPGFLPTAPAVYTRCVRVMESNLIVIKVGVGGVRAGGCVVRMPTDKLCTPPPSLRWRL